MSAQTIQWSPDSTLPSFDATTLHFSDDYDGEVTATLVRRNATTPTKRAVLYVHGWADYFFQTHLADAYNEHHYNFYALDLRKHGRCLKANHHPNYCKSVEEYFAELSAAIRIIKENDGNDWLVLNGHSTGGLTTSLYADAGELCNQLDAVFLNSPFFRFNLPGVYPLIRLVAMLAPLFPYIPLQEKKPSPYVQSIHQDYHGEWAINLAWKPLNNFPIYAGWCRAILQAQAQVRKGLAIQCPVLVMHSDKSIYGDEWTAEFQSGDAVLNVEDMKEISQFLGKHVQRIEIENGLHDLTLSAEEVRQHVFAELFGWLDALPAT